MEGRVRAAVHDTDPLDPVDPVACSKLVFRVRETLLFVLRTHKSPHSGFKNYNVAILGAEKAPAGMLTRKTDSLERKGAILCLENTKITICLFPKYRSLFFEK